MDRFAARSLMLRLVLFIATILVLANNTEVRAGYATQTFTLSQSNTAGADGINYGSVKVEAYDGSGASGGLATGQVRFTVTVNSSAYGSIQSNFGMDMFGFNSDLSLQSTNSGLGNYVATPSGWSVDIGNQNMDGFGDFSVEFSSSGDRFLTAEFDVYNLGANATLAHFLFGSKKQNGGTPDEGSVYFAAHVADFNGGKSHYVGALPEDGGGGTLLTPEPATMTMTLIGFVGLGLSHGLRRLRRLRPQFT